MHPSLVKLLNRIEQDPEIADRLRREAELNYHQNEEDDEEELPIIYIEPRLPDGLDSQLPDGLDLPS